MAQATMNEYNLAFWVVKYQNWLTKLQVKIAHLNEINVQNKIVLKPYTGQKTVMIKKQLLAALSAPKIFQLQKIDCNQEWFCLFK